MSEDRNISKVEEIGEIWARPIHRKASISRCENGYVVKYQMTSSNFREDQYNPRTVDNQRVFITNDDMLEFIENYFSGEPRP